MPEKFTCDRLCVRGESGGGGNNWVITFTFKKKNSKEFNFFVMQKSKLFNKN